VRKHALIIGLIVGTALVAALVAPSRAKPQQHAKQSRAILVGIFDEQSSLGSPDWAFPQYKTLGVEALRVNLYWGGPSGVARKKRPVNARNPADPAYDWAVYDLFVKTAAANHIKPVFSILWTPRWAGPAKNRSPRRTIDLRNFAFAAAKRYSGSFHPDPNSPDTLPAVRYWLAWNEPNNPVFLQPQFQKIGRRKYRLASPRIYAGMCNAVMSGVHLTGLPGEKVACGVTAPRGNNTGTQPRPSVSPLIFLRGLKRAHARFDVYAHHPYYQHPNESPSKPPPGPRAVTLGNINELLRELRRLYGNKHLWITEYGYQTNPPDRSFGVSWIKQARYVSQAFGIARRNPRIDMMIWFLVKDERRIGNGWQSGLYTASGRRKPSFQAFRRMRK
jgi:hypothetical protein